MTDDAHRAVIQCLALIDINRPRNGHHSAENEFADRLQRKISEFFSIQPVNVNVLIQHDQQLRRVLGLESDC